MQQDGLRKKQRAVQSNVESSPGRRLLQTHIPQASAGSTLYSSLAGVGVTSQAYSPHQQWVVLRSLATNTFVSVEPPPHSDAMIVHGRGESISLNNVFGFLRGGFLWSKSIDSLLAICSQKNEVCTGYLEKPDDPHLKRLQTPADAAHFEFKTVALPPCQHKPQGQREDHACEQR